MHLLSFFITLIVILVTTDSGLKNYECPLLGVFFKKDTIVMYTHNHSNEYYTINVERFAGLNLHSFQEYCESLPMNIRASL